MPQHLYSTLYGRCLLKILTAPTVSKIVGAFMNSYISKLMISPFIRNNKIDMSDFKTESWSCFNEFFTRNLRPGKRKINQNPNILIAPCDGFLTVYNIAFDSTVSVKGTQYTVEELTNNSNLANEYEDGLCLVFRLTPANYHRYIYPDTGAKGKNTFIHGILHTVRPIALTKYPVYKTNCREYTVLRTNNFDDIVFMEVGAMMVGKICNYHQEYNFKRGEEKGKFEFGGSTIIMLIKKNQALIDTDIKDASNNGKEFPIQLGEQIGIKL